MERARKDFRCHNPRNEPEKTDKRRVARDSARIPRSDQGSLPKAGKRTKSPAGSKSDGGSENPNRQAAAVRSYRLISRFGHDFIVKRVVELLEERNHR
jgi:hypothetical protein